MALLDQSVPHEQPRRPGGPVLGALVDGLATRRHETHRPRQRWGARVAWRDRHGLVAVDVADDGIADGDLERPHELRSSTVRTYGAGVGPEATGVPPGDRCSQRLRTAAGAQPPQPGGAFSSGPTTLSSCSPGRAQPAGPRVTAPDAGSTQRYMTEPYQAPVLSVTVPSMRTSHAAPHAVSLVMPRSVSRTSTA